MSLPATMYHVIDCCKRSITFDFGELYSGFVASIVVVHVTLSKNVPVVHSYICMHIYIDDISYVLRDSAILRLLMHQLMRSEMVYLISTLLLCFAEFAILPLVRHCPRHPRLNQRNQK